MKFRIKRRTFTGGLQGFATFLFVSIMLTYSQVGYANRYGNSDENQEKFTITGKVIDESGETIVGVNITIKGTMVGTVTDNNGNYSIQATTGDVLLFSFIGMTSQEVVVGIDKVINITLVSDTKNLDELVVIGYGVQKKKDLSGSVVSVNMNDLSKIKSLNPMQALQGVASGVSVTTTSGTPGAGASINIRGITTLGTNAPLYIIDGVPGSLSNLSQEEIDGVSGSLSNLSQEEIESISILKDASAAAIYGTRAAGGVVLIQTKRGQRNQGYKISYSNSFSWQKSDHFMDMCNASEYKKVYSMLASTDGDKTNPAAVANAIANGDPIGEFNGVQFVANDYAFNYDKLDLNNQKVYSNTNWQQEMFRTAGTQQHTMVISGGTENTNMSISGNYTDQQGTLIGSSFKKGGVRINSDITKDWLKLGESISFNRRQGTNFQSTGYGQMYDILSALPHVFVRNSLNEGGFGGYFNDIPESTNPVARALIPTSEYKHEYLSMSGYSEITFLKDFKYRFNIGVNSENYNNLNFSPTYYVSPREFLDVNTLNESRSRSQNWLAENLLTYTKTFAEKHQIDVLLGYSAEKNNSRYLYAKGEKLPYNELPVLDLSTESKEVGSNTWEKTMVSTFGRVNYSYDGKYFLQANFRRDGSSNFGKQNRYGFFPSVSAAWNLSREDFFKIPFINDFKVRASYGRLGNDQIGSYQYLQTVAGGFYYINGLGQLITGMTGYSLANEAIKWEITSTADLGVDLSLLKNQLTFTFDYFNKKTDDILVSLNLPWSFGGATSQLMNAASVRNTGYELSLNWKETKGSFSYSVGGNFSSYTNKVFSLGSRKEPIWGTDIDWNSGSVTRTAIHGTISEFYVWKTAGIFNSQDEVDEWNLQGHTDEDGNFTPLQEFAQPGDIRFIDKNKDGILDDKDRTKLGSPIPDFSYSFNFSVAWKGVDLFAMFNGVYGNEIFNGIKYRTERMDNYWNYSKNALKAWTPQNMNTDVPRATKDDLNGNRRVSDRYIESGTYLRLKTVQIGYSIPSKYLSKVKIDKCRIYLGSENLFTITDYTGFDPEVYGDDVFNRGIDWGRYPLYKNFIVGLEIKF